MVSGQLCCRHVTKTQQPPRSSFFSRLTRWKAGCCSARWKYPTAVSSNTDGSCRTLQRSWTRRIPARRHCFYNQLTQLLICVFISPQCHRATSIHPAPGKDMRAFPPALCVGKAVCFRQTGHRTNCCLGLVPVPTGSSHSRELQKCIEQIAAKRKAAEENQRVQMKPTSTLLPRCMQRLSCSFWPVLWE